MANAAAINALSSNATTSFTVTASDGSLTGTSTLAVNLTGANDTPIVVQPTAIALTDTAAPDPFANVTGTLVASDAEGSTLSYGIQGGTESAGVSSLTNAYGTLSVNTTSGAYTFVANAAAINALRCEERRAGQAHGSHGSLTRSATRARTLTGPTDTPTMARP